MCAKRKTPYGKSKIHIPFEDHGDVRVLYIHPAKQGGIFQINESMGRSYGIIPVGLPAIINYLKQEGIAVRGMNYALERQRNADFNIQEWLNQFPAARVILIDLHWYEHCYGAIQTAQKCKEILPNAYTVLGGLSASGFSRQILDQFPEVDFILRGDAEKPLLALVQRILQQEASYHDIPNLSFRDGTGIRENECTYCAATADLDGFDFANIDFLDHYRDYYVHEYVVTNIDAARKAQEKTPFWGKWICTARGCKHECSYCGGCKSAHKTLANRDGIVVRSPQAVVKEIQKLQQAGILQASLSYDIAELGEAYWKDFFTLMKSNQVKIGLYNEFFQLPEPEFIREFGRIADRPHSCVALSPLSGSEHVRRLNGKLFSNDQLLDTLDVLNQYQTNIFVYFSLNLPGETNDTYEETLDFAKLIYDYYPHSRLKILNTVHTIDPLSPMNVHPEKFGIESSMSSFMDYYHYCENTQLISEDAKSEKYRGFNLTGSEKRSIQRMAGVWDKQRTGRESSWWPIPPSW